MITAKNNSAQIIVEQFCSYELSVAAGPWDACMILFKPMNDKEYLTYVDYFVSDYATEIASNYGLSELAALEQANQEISDNLPDGANTHGQELVCVMKEIDSTETLIGYLWYKHDTSLRPVFIYDFCILEEYQGNGLGKQTLQAFERNLRTKGFEQIKLRVAADNERARHIYEATGFRVTGVNMCKVIGDA